MMKTDRDTIAELRKAIEDTCPQDHCRSCDGWLCGDDDGGITASVDRVLAAVLKVLGLEE